MRFYRALVFFFLFSSPVYAVDYYWQMDGFGQYSGSPIQICEAYMADLPKYPSEPQLGTASFFLVEPALGRCHYTAIHNSGLVLTDVPTPNLVRRGDGCTDPDIYNPETGVCEPPESTCEDKVGESEPFGRSGTRGDGWYSTVQSGGKTYGVTPGEACLNGCAATLNQNCVYRISTDSYICRGTAYFNGSSCSAGDPAVDSDPLQRDIDPEVTNDKEPCVYVEDAEGRQTCVSKSTLEEEGQNCGMAGPPGSEQRVCVPKQATKEEKKTETEIEEKPTPDGGKETVKKDVHTETKCTGSPSNCTTTTTTTTTTTKSDGSGTTTKTTTTCKGANCGKDGTVGGGGGGGGGSGDGDDEYDAPGDLVGNDDVPGFGESLGNFSSRIQGSPVVSAVQSISFPSGGSCNMPSANVYLIGTVSFDWFCQNADILDALYYVMLGVFALGAVRLFLEA